MTGSSNVTNLTNDPSVINFLPPVGDPTLLSSYKTLTTTNYVRVDGQIRLNTYLAGDGSPSDLGHRRRHGDRHDNGDRNRYRRRGALTTGDGILVIDAVNGGTTAPGAFAGFGAAGPYEYLLERGGLTAGSESEWFLRSPTLRDGRASHRRFRFIRPCR